MALEYTWNFKGRNKNSSLYGVEISTLVLRNWYIGKRIDEEVLQGAERAEYGAEVIKNLSKI